MFRLFAVRDQVLAKTDHEITLEGKCVRLRLGSGPAQVKPADRMKICVNLLHRATFTVMGMFWLFMESFRSGVKVQPRKLHRDFLLNVSQILFLYFYILTLRIMNLFPEIV